MGFWSSVQFYLNVTGKPTPVAGRSKAWVYDHLLAGTGALNHAGDIDVCFL